MDFLTLQGTVSGNFVLYSGIVHDLRRRYQHPGLSAFQVGFYFYSPTPSLRERDRQSRLSKAENVSSSAVALIPGPAVGSVRFVRACVVLPHSVAVCGQRCALPLP